MLRWRTSGWPQGGVLAVEGTLVPARDHSVVEWFETCCFAVCAHPPVFCEAVRRLLWWLGYWIGRLHRDRAFGEVRDGGGPLRVVWLFGMCLRTVMACLYAVHPGRFRRDVIAP